MRNHLFFVAVLALSGCATNFEPSALSPDNPASAQAEEAPRTGMRRLSASDQLTNKTKAQLARNETPTSEPQAGGMSHDMSTMSGVDHSQMKGMKPDANAAPAKKEAVDAEMRKTADEMKEVSKQLKAKSGEARPAGSAASKPVQAIYTCRMHPQIRSHKPGQCPICGMTLVKKS